MQNILVVVDLFDINTGYRSMIKWLTWLSIGLYRTSSNILFEVIYDRYGTIMKNHISNTFFIIILDILRIIGKTLLLRDILKRLVNGLERVDALWWGKNDGIESALIGNVSFNLLKATSIFLERTLCKKRSTWNLCVIIILNSWNQGFRVRHFQSQDPGNNPRIDFRLENF